MRASKRLSAALLAAGLSVGPAQAAIITYNDDFTASNFTADYGNVPYAVVTGSFAVTFDNTQTYLESTAITASASIPFDDGPIKFDYNSSSDTLSFSGTRLNLGVGVQNDTNNFYLIIDNASTSAPSAALIYATTDPAYDSLYHSGNVVLTPAAVPEPTSLALLGTGLLGLVMTRRRKAHTAR